MSVCSNCGAEIPEGARICPVCTHPVETKKDPPAPAQPGVPQSPEGQLSSEHPAGAPVQPPPQAGPYAAAPQVVVKTTEGKAIGALICGILGFVVCPLILSIVAVILSRMAQKSIKESGGLKEGEGMATAALVLGIIGIVYGLFIVLFFVGIFGMAMSDLSGF